MKENLRVTDGMLEITALGLESIGFFLFMYGIQDTRLGLDLIKYDPRALQNPIAVEFVKGFLQRGLREVALGIGVLSGSARAAIERIVK